MDSLREYLDFVSARDLLLEIEETVAREDIPELIDLLSPRGQAILFKKVEGYQCAVAANIVPSHDTLGALLGGGDFYETFLRGVSMTRAKVPRERGGLASIDLKGRDLISMLPILRYCEHDSAPFITTGIVSSKDPESGVVGRGIHRMEYRGGNRLGVAFLNPPLVDIFRRYEAKGEPMPITVTVGVDPLLFLSMALKVAPETDKLEVAGGLKGKGVAVIQSSDSPVDVPEGAEFYLEGYVDPKDTSRDGPLGEISGYYLTIEKTPTFVVNRVFHRPSPLFHVLPPTSLEADTYLTFVSRAHVEQSVKRLFPFMQGIFFVPGTFGSSVIVSVGASQRGKVRSLMLSMLTFPMIKKVTIVDSDIRADNLRDVEWAVVTRCDADRDVTIIPGLQGQPIDPWIVGDGGVAKIGIDATLQGKDIEARARVAPGNAAAVKRLMGIVGGAK
ncbi:MAG: UbiD family decarboxylase [Syntrophorhabdales bacterium]|jgi:2,5-furandicarboxylate decarboxylase 1